MSVVRFKRARYLPQYLLMLCFTGWLAPSSLAAVEEAPEQSFQTCGLISSELMTLTQLMLAGADVNTLETHLPIAHAKTREVIRALDKQLKTQGGQAVMLAIHRDYARCAQRVHDRFGLPPVGTAEYAFQVCAGESRIRTEIIMAAERGARVEDLAGQLPDDHHDILAQLVTTVQKEGALAALNQSANLLKRCMNAVAAARAPANR